MSVSSSIVEVPKVIVIDLTTTKPTETPTSVGASDCSHHELQSLAPTSVGASVALPSHHGSHQSNESRGVCRRLIFDADIDVDDRNNHHHLHVDNADDDDYFDRLFGDNCALSSSSCTSLSFVVSDSKTISHCMSPKLKRKRLRRDISDDDISE